MIFVILPNKIIHMFSEYTVFRKKSPTYVFDYKNNSGILVDFYTLYTNGNRNT